ncbi:MAG: TonB-dependent receptor [Burkholderiales bacterium]|nr:TonB-dependent receptor [Burkholderiales bacterium]
MSTRFSRPVSALAALLVTSPALAGGEQVPDQALPTLEISSSRINQIGVADSANQGTVTAKQLENRPLARTGELLEAVPGVIVTQHSGDGKANQYFARGFNLDHGTDFRTTVLGMPVNLPTNAHGQGYSDLNFVIPELVKTIQYKKGTYYAEEGDFSAAGAAAIDYFRVLDKGLFSVEVGQHNFRRIVAANSSALGAGNLLYAFEGAGNNGPWNSPENYKRFNGVLSYSWKSGSDDSRVTAMAMQSSWNATDQVPRRALSAGSIGRFDTIDPTDGGDTSRFSLSANWTRRLSDGAYKVDAYLVRSSLDLFSNFTYASSSNGASLSDQFQQSERRTIAGLNAERTWFHQLGKLDMETTVGAQFRRDRMAPVGLYSTVARQRVAITREDQVTESASALFASNTTHWTPWLRTTAGLRADWYSFDVAGNNPANSGSKSDSIVSPKFSAIFTPTKDAEIYLNWGKGFHSNDARGVTDPAMPATPLVKAIGKEIGLRLTDLVPKLQTSLSFWQLDLGSELVFVGDAGTTQASRPSHRNGIELANYYTPAPGWIIDADFAWSRARFTDTDPSGPYIPGAIERTLSVGMSGDIGRWSGGVRLRYFGGRPLVSDNSVRSPSSTLINAKIGYAISKDVKITAEILNLFNREASDVDYYYASQLRGEAAAVADIHTHPAEPRSFRLGVAVKF